MSGRLRFPAVLASFVSAVSGRLRLPAVLASFASAVSGRLRRGSAAPGGPSGRRVARSAERSARLPHGSAKRRAVREMFDAIAPRYDLVNRIMTLRLDVGWRRRTVRELGLPPGSVVADLACGTGDLCRELARSGCRPFGFDLSMGMLKAAPVGPGGASGWFRRRRIPVWELNVAPVGPGGAPLVHADVLALPLRDGALDGATCGFALRNVASVPGLFDEMARAVRPGGRIALLEVDTPRNPVLRWGHRVYFGRVVPLIGAALSDRDAYRYLPESVAYLPSAEELTADLRAAGFSGVRHQRLSAGIAQLVTATRA